MKFTAITFNTITISIGLLLVKASAFGRDILIAKYFGMSGSVDLYIYALLVPSLIHNGISFSFNYYFIPTYIQKKHEVEDAEVCRRYASFIQFIFMGFVLVLSCLMYLFLHDTLLTLNASYFESPEHERLFVEFSQLASVFFFFLTSSTLFRALLQAEHIYNWTTYPQGLMPLVSGIFLVLGHEKWGLMSSMYGLLCGSIAYFLIQCLLAVRKNLLTFHISKTDIDGFWTSMKAKQFFFALFAINFSTLMNFIDRNIAISLGEGRLSVLNYGQAIPSALTSVIAVSSGTALFSHLSQWMAKDQESKIRTSVQRCMTVALTMLIPMCMFIFIYATELLTFFFQRGAFKSSDTHYVSIILRAYIFSVILSFIMQIGFRFISAQSKTQLLLKMYVCMFGLKMGMNYMLVKQYGLVGLPISTMLMVTVAVSYMLYHIQRTVDFFNHTFRSAFFVKLFQTLLFCVAIWAVRWVTPYSDPLWILGLGGCAGGVLFLLWHRETIRSVF